MGSGLGWVGVKVRARGRDRVVGRAEDIARLSGGKVRLTHTLLAPLEDLRYVVGR